MNKIISITAAFAVSAALLWLAFRHADLRLLAAAAAAASPAPLLLVLPTVLMELAIRGLKWKLLLAPAVPARTRDALRIEAAGLALNNVLPLRLGDIARGLFGARFFKTGLVTVFTTILAEKALDLAAISALSAAAAALTACPGSSRGALGALFAAVAAAAFLLWACRGRLKEFPRVRHTLQDLELGLKAFRSPAAAAGIFGLAVLQWLMNALNYYWLALAFGISGTITVTRCVLLSAAGAAASSAPGMPGFFGNFELAVSAALAAWGVNKETALACAALTHITSYLIITVAGLFFIYQMGETIGGIWHRLSDVRPGERQPGGGAV